MSKITYKKSTQQSHIYRLTERLCKRSILNVQEGKYYLNTDRIEMAGGEILLHSDHLGPLAICQLIQDYQGTYTMGMYTYHQCNGCGTIYNSRPSTCSVCGGTSFRLGESLPAD